MKKRIPLIVFALIIAVILCGRTCGKEEATSKDIEILKKTSKAFTDVAKKAMPAVVFIRVEKTIETRGYRSYGQFNDPFGFFGDEFFERFFRGKGFSPIPRQFKQRGQGSGFIISEDGYILTNNHVVGDADKISVKLHDGRKFEAKRIGSDPRSEVAVIKIEGKKLPFLEPGDSSTLEIGEWVIAVGNPFGLTETLTVGVVSAKGRSNIGIADYEDFIQTDAAINPGNSGGPLLNIDGDVVGINTAIFSQSGGYMGIGFAIPINMAEAIKDQLVKSGKVVRGYIGIAIKDVTDDLAEQFGLKKIEGILIDEVVEDSAGEKAGLEHGDIILKMDGKKVENAGAFRNTVASNPPGTKFVLTIFRNHETENVTVKTAMLSDEKVVTTESSDLFEKLGMDLQNLTQDLAGRFGYEMNQGVIVSKVEIGGQAADKGIRPGYLITSVGRKKISSVAEFIEAVEKTKRREKILLRVIGERYAHYVAMTVE